MGSLVHYFPFVTWPGVVQKITVCADAVQTASPGDNHLTQRKRVQDAQEKSILAFCFLAPKSNSIQFRKPATGKNTRTTATTNDSSLHDVLDCSLVFSPSKWARLYFLTCTVFYAFYSPELVNNEEEMTIVNSITRSPSLRENSLIFWISLWVRGMTMVWSLLR